MLKKPRKPSPTESSLPFEIDPEPLNETLTARGGVSLVVQTFRSLGLPASIRRLLHLKERDRGYDEATMVESLVVLNAVGGDCVDDLDHLREDQGLVELLGHTIPSATSGRTFLNQFHSEEKVKEAMDARQPDEKAYIPGENAALEGLGQVNRDLIREFAARRPEQRIATVDQDATIIESHKQQALHTYEGPRGYQPMLAVWAETGLVLADEFRDGNVPAMMSPLSVAQRSFNAFAGMEMEFYYRGDSASHENELIQWLRNEERPNGPRGYIGFAISARMSEALHKAIRGIPEAQWQLYGTPHPTEIRECAEVDFVPGERSEHKDTQPLRYVAIRIRHRQEELFSDGSKEKHFAIVSNRWDLKPGRLIEWHREKAGTVELVHDVLKNELTAGVMPSKYFGANAAWLRIAVISHNVLTAMKWIALPPELLRARPKRLRFLFINVAGRIVQHARRTLLKLATEKDRILLWIEAMNLLPITT